MQLNQKYLAIILNRNLGFKCDKLRENLLDQGISAVVVVDSSTDNSLQSKFTSVGAVDRHALDYGYRINRGFNLGLNFALENHVFDWIFCFPVDTELIKFDLETFDYESKNLTKIMAYPLPERDNPYLSLIKNRFGLVWNIIEGPILLRYNLVAQYKKGNKYSLFDNTNFRGYLSFKELALRIYAANFAVGICPHFLVEENETLLLNFFELMKTEDFSTNKRLLISEGQKWLFDKYGITNRWAFETIVRLLYEEFFHVNPEYCSLRI